MENQLCHYIRQRGICQEKSLYFSYYFWKSSIRGDCFANIAKNIAHVKYLLQNGSYVELYVNTTLSDYDYNGTVIPAYGYAKVA